jgi:signal peptidase I
VQHDKKEARKTRLFLFASLIATAIVAFAWRRSGAWPPISRYIVDGTSMEPAYSPGDRVLVNRLAYWRSSPRIGDVVVVRDPQQPERWLLKRVAPPPAQLPADEVWLLGDNAKGSRDSRQFGAIPRALIVGRASRKY